MLLRVSSSLSGSRHAVTTDIILAGHAPGVPSGHHLLADIVSAPIAASAGERTHVTVRIAVLYLQLVSIRTTHAVRAQVEVAILLARVVTTACCNLEVRSAPITDQACAARSVDMALGIAPLLLLPGPVEDERVILTACRGHGSGYLIDGHLGRLTIHGTAGAYIVVTILTVTAEVADLWSNTGPAQVTIHSLSRAHAAVAIPRERARLVTHGMSGTACFVRSRLVHDCWSGLIYLLLLIGLKLCIFRLELSYPLFQLPHFEDEGNFASVSFDVWTFD